MGWQTAGATMGGILWMVAAANAQDAPSPLRTQWAESVVAQQVEESDPESGSPVESPEEEPDGDEQADPAPVGLPSQGFLTPSLPPALQVDPQQPSPTRATVPVLPTSSDDLRVPQDPLEVRIEARQTLGLQEALDTAVERNPDVQLAQLRIERAQTEIDRAEASFAPGLSSDGRISYSQPPNLSGMGGDSFGVSGSLVQVDYTIADSGRRQSALAAAQERQGIAQLQLQQVQQSLRLTVATAYYDLQAADALVAINDAAVANSEASLGDAQARERAGLGTRFDVLQAETELANNRQQLLGSLNQQQQRRRALAELLNLETPTDLVAIDPIEPSGEWDQSLEDTIILAFANRPELELERRNFDLAAEQVRGALASTGPIVSGFASIDYGANLQGTFRSDLGYAAGASVSLPWFDGGDSAAQARGFEIDEQIAARTFEQTRNQIARSVQDAFLTLNSSREQIDSAKTAIATAEESLRLARLRFQAGVGTQTEVINAESALTTARGNLSDAIIAYNRSLVALQRAVNLL